MDKTILLPDMKAGCSLAESITGADVRLLKEKYPGVPVVTYVNTSAEVKAETDICCTSGNVVKIIERLRDEGHKQVFCIPDKYLAQNTQNQVEGIEILTWEGACEVHEKFTPEDIKRFRNSGEDVVVLAHPECPPEVMAEADLSGSTAQMISYVQEKQPKRVILITECSMGDNITAANPNVEFVRSCQLCPHMKRITLPKILDCLKNMSGEILVDPDVAAEAKHSVDRMLEYSA
jgi:quinolinate synthase